MRSWQASLAALATLAVAAHARSDEGARLALDLSGVRYGLVRATPTADKSLVVTAQDITPALVALVDTFTRGAPVKRDVRLTSGAIVRKTNDARLVSVKLPALGSGGAPEIELAFAASPLTTQPLLSVKESPPLPASARIEGFRVDLTGMTAIEAAKVDAIVVVLASALRMERP